ncbi:PAS domain-containing protein, partial [Rhizobiaceae sp. 2RAB30]
GMVGTFDWHIPSDKLYSDARFAEMFSVDPVEAEKGAPIAAFMGGIHPDDRPRIAKAVDDAIANGAKYAQEYRLLRADSTVRWIEARGECLYDQGKPTRFPGAAVDITERKRAEEVERRLAAIIASSEDAILSTDLDMKVTSWNWGAERLYGYTADEVIGQSVMLLVPEDRPAEEAAIIERICRGERVEPHETQRRHKDGGLIHVSLT